MKIDDQLVKIKEFVATDGSEVVLEFIVSPIKTWENLTEFANELGIFVSYGEYNNLCNRIDSLEKYVVSAQDEHFNKTVTWLNESHVEEITLKPRYDNEKCWVIWDGFPCTAIMWIEGNNYYAIFWSSTA